ncbi:hypothetical protein P7K49_013389, partial [Saguinus oedipus]
CKGHLEIPESPLATAGRHITNAMVLERNYNLALLFRKASVTKEKTGLNCHHCACEKA